MLSVTPTAEEALCEADPYLPLNRPGGSPHLTAGSPEAHVDLHFRLLRSDALDEQCQRLRTFLKQPHGQDKLHGSKQVRER